MSSLGLWLQEADRMKDQRELSQMREARQRSVHQSPVTEESVLGRVEGMANWEREKQQRIEAKRAQQAADNRSPGRFSLMVAFMIL